ncbi:hypothetical protein M0804_010917 [Polistes exclamans]|nr:hypothetical protein M0804_010917 [Polistes exclamans]
MKLLLTLVRTGFMHNYLLTRRDQKDLRSTQNCDESILRDVDEDTSVLEKPQDTRFVGGGGSRGGGGGGGEKSSSKQS